MITKQIDLVIIGGGPAGLSAAIAAKESRIDNLLVIERNDFLGGILNQCIHNGFGLEILGEDLTGPEFAKRLTDKIEELKIPYWLDSIVLDITKNKEVIVSNKNGIFRIKAKSIIIATGCRERTRGNLAIPGSRPSGVFTAGTAQQFINQKNLMIGKKIVILGSGDIGLIMARRLKLEGAEVIAVIEILPYSRGLKRNIKQCLEDFDIPLYYNHTITEIKGKDRVTSVIILEVDEKLNPIKGTEKHIECDTILISVGLIPENEILLNSGVKIYKPIGGAIVNENYETNIRGIFECGNSLHVHDTVDSVVIESKKAGKSAAQYLKGGLEKKDSIINKNFVVDKIQEDRDWSYICIICPKSCKIFIENSKIRGFECDKGLDYVKDEIVDPKRIVTTTIKVKNGKMPLVSVKTDKPISKDDIFELLKVISHKEVNAPVRFGEKICENLLNKGIDIMATTEVPLKTPDY